MFAVFALLALSAPVAITGCGPSAASLCDAKCDCEGCSAHDYDQCRLDADYDEDVAARRGCLDYYDDYIACQDATWICRGADWETSCKPERDRWKKCVD